MKKIFKYSLLLLFGMLFCLNVNAECNDEELNEWATGVKSVFTENKDLESEGSEYAYFLSIDPYREDVKIFVTDQKGNKAEGKKFESRNLYAVGANTNLEEETYTIEVYGNEKSACSNELLKTLTYTVPRFNRMVKNEECVNNQDLEICKTFTNSTKDMTDSDFKKEVKGQISEKDPFSFKKVINVITDYGLYIIIPIIILSLLYFIKVKKYKKEERDR